MTPTHCFCLPMEATLPTSAPNAACCRELRPRDAPRLMATARTDAREIRTVSELARRSVSWSELVAIVVPMSDVVRAENSHGRSESRSVTSTRAPIGMDSDCCATTGGAAANATTRSHMCGQFFNLYMFSASERGGWLPSDWKGGRLHGDRLMAVMFTIPRSPWLQQPGLHLARPRTWTCRSALADGRVPGQPHLDREERHNPRCPFARRVA